MGYGRKRIPSLIDSGSQVTLICQSYFEREILPHIIPSSREKAEAHQLFQLTAANNEMLFMSMYQIRSDFWGVMVQEGGVLFTQEPNGLLVECHKTKLPSVIGWNMINWPIRCLLTDLDKTALKILTVQQVSVCSYFPSFVYFTTTKQMESSQQSKKTNNLHP